MCEMWQYLSLSGEAMQPKRYGMCRLGSYYCERRPRGAVFAWRLGLANFKVRRERVNAKVARNPIEM